MEYRIWPSVLPRDNDYSSLEKNIYRCIDKNLKKGWCLLHIDPVGMSNDSVQFGVVILEEVGILSFSIQSTTSYEDFRILSDTYTDLVSSKITNLLMESALLIYSCNGGKGLRFNYRHINIFNDDSICDDENCYNVSIFEDENNIAELLSKDGNESGIIGEAEARAIINKLAPEYTVVKPEIVSDKPIEEVNESVYDLPEITGKEIEYATFLLDDNQVRFVNEIETGHRVLLANAGAGKSVLLLSKAYRYASANKNGRVLITCYNANLADSYRFKNACANYGDNNNVYIMTFNKLVTKIYKEYLNYTIPGDIASEDDIQNLLTYIQRGQVNLSFSAIFIDEVQIFNPVYLEICYSLLSKSEDALFLMAGDLNQTVRSQSRRGDAPWKKINKGRLKFNGRVRYLRDNYRNSSDISTYLNEMLVYMNHKMSEYGLISENEYEYNLLSEGKAENVALKIETGISRMDISKSIINAIKEISSAYHIPYSDIAILFPYKERKVNNYYTLYWLKQALSEEGIEYSVIFDEGQNQRKYYSNTNGVVLSTIDSSLGLDFKAVILTGLFPYSFIPIENYSKAKKVTSWSQIEKFSEDEKESVKIQFRKIYTACSRARQVLYVLSDIEKGSPFEDILEDRR